MNKGFAKGPLVFLLVFFLLVLVASSAIAFIADIYYFQAKKFEYRWERNPLSLNYDDWLDSKYHIDKALKLSAKHPDYLQFLGRLSIWRYFVNETPDSQLSSQSLEAFRESLLERPYWPYAWAELVLLKSQLGQIDEEFQLAFNKALAYGPWEHQVIVNLFNAGLGSWSDLSGEQREQLLSLFERGVAYNTTTASGLMVVAESNGLAIVFCGIAARKQLLINHKSCNI